MPAFLSIFRQTLGSDYFRLDDVAQRMHDLHGHHVLSGSMTGQGATTPIGRLAARLLRLPQDFGRCALTLSVKADTDRERWTVQCPAATLHCTLWPKHGQLFQTIGPFRLRYRSTIAIDRLSMRLDGMSVAGLPIPLAFGPQIEAEEYAGNGDLHFFVRASWPGSRRLFAYRGTLNMRRDIDEISRTISNQPTVRMAIGD